MRRRLSIAAIAVAAAFTAPVAFAHRCANLPDHDTLRSALQAAVTTERSNAPNHNGLGFNMWATVVDSSGVVCAVAFSGAEEDDQWLASRVISAQKANTANSLSLSGPLPGTNVPNGLALSSGNLYGLTLEGGSLFGLQFSNPVDPRVAYEGDASDFGTSDDPMVGHRIGGVNVFGGGLGLYGAGEKRIGGVGVSGDTSCEDHMVAWRLRHNLGLDHLLHVGGASGDAARPDNIVFALNPAPNTFQHPMCAGTGDPTQLPAVQN